MAPYHVKMVGCFKVADMIK